MAYCERLIAAFGSHIRSLRTTAGLSQEQLADASALHRTYIGSVTRRESDVSHLMSFYTPAWRFPNKQAEALEGRGCVGEPGVIHERGFVTKQSPGIAREPAEIARRDEQVSAHTSSILLAPWSTGKSVTSCGVHGQLPSPTNCQTQPSGVRRRRVTLSSHLG
jgi:hypothetical protein